MEISIVVPARNAARTIGGCLQSLLEQSVSRERYEVIVVDDGSTDETRQMVERSGATLMAQAQQGPAAARNKGVSVSKGDIVLFTDADCVPEANWVQEMIRAFEDGEIAGAKGVYRTRQTGIIPRFVQCEYEERYELMAKQRWIDFIDTYSAGYRREIFVAEGGFDTRYPSASVEDQEFSFRLAERGHKMVFNPRAVVYHQHPETLTAYFKRKFNIGYWKVMVLRRHPGKAVRDSHTPQTLKIQMGLAVLLLPLLALLLVRSFFCSLPLLTLVLFLTSALPFTVKALRKDPVVGLFSPILLFVRALALGLGMVKGGWDAMLRRERAN
ncbi:MAG TPA: glycosyltransferase [Anaerolineae bacterium]|nr:glycosyltransferase [Anaerolineae bacterium]